MITRQQLLQFPIDTPLAEWTQLFDNSCLATSLDFISGNHNAEYQNLWNQNRHLYNAALADLNTAPAPGKEEIIWFLSGYGKFPSYVYRHMDTYTPALAVEVGNIFARYDMFICACVGHARVYFRNEGRIFIPGRAEGLNSLLFQEAAPLTINVGQDNNGRMTIDGEATPMIMALNYA